MASKAELLRTETLVSKFNSGASLFNPDSLVASLVVLEDGSNEYSIEVSDQDGDLVETFSALSEFSEWILDVESGYVG
jgi:hypothetical protein